MVGAGLLSRLASVPMSVRIIGACALAAWVVGAVLYSRAVAEPVAINTEMPNSAEEFVSEVLKNAEEERDKVDSRRKLAQRVSMVAAAFTTLAVVLGLLITSGPEKKTASIVLTAQGAAVFRILCGAEANLVRGQVNIASLESEFISLRPETPRCASRELRLYRSEIVEIVVSN